MITLKSKTDKKASLKLLNQINSFLFEQQYDELRKFSPNQLKAIQNAAKALKEVINNG